MAFFLLQAAYTPDGWKALIEHPQNRIEAIKPAIEQLDGTVVDGWLSFGEYDIVAILDLPTNVSAAAMSMAFSAGGVLKSAQDDAADLGGGGRRGDGARLRVRLPARHGLRLARDRWALARAPTGPAAILGR